MGAVYMAIVAVLLCSIAGLTLYRPRQGVLSLLSIVFFCNGALPWELVPVAKLASVVEGGLAILCIGYCLFFRTDRHRASPSIFNGYNLLTFLFLLLLIINLVSSNSLVYGEFKTEVFALEGVLPIFALACLAPFSNKDIQTIVLSIVAGAGTVMCRVFFVGHIVTNTYTSTILNSNVISMGRYIGLGAVALLVLYLFRRRMSVLRSTGIFLVVILMVVAMMVIGERGPVLGIPFALALAAMLVSRPGTQLLRLAGRIIVVAGITVGSFLILNSLGLGNARSLRVVNYLAGQGSGNSGRLERFQAAWQAFVHSHGLGIGTGGFTSYFGSPYYDYPHNLFFEIACEEGLLGLLLFGAILIVIGQEIVRRSRSREWDTWSIVMFGGWLFLFFNAQVSGDIGANAPLWVFASLLWMYRPDENEVQA